MQMYVCRLLLGSPPPPPASRGRIHTGSLSLRRSSSRWSVSARTTSERSPMLTKESASASATWLEFGLG